MLQFRQIQALHAVIESGTVVGAAGRLSISQPGVSNLISSLEHHVGLKLFERIKGRLHPTPEALELFDSIEAVIAGFEHVDQKASTLNLRNTGRLTVGALPELSLEYLPSLISSYLREHPQIKLSFQTRSSVKVQELLADHSLEVGVAEGPLEHENLQGKSFSFNCYCAIPKGHGLTDREIIRPQDLDGEPFVSLGTYHMTYHRLRDILSAHGCKWNERCQVRTFYAALAMVREGIGVALVDPFTIKARDMPEVVIRPFEIPVLLDLQVVWARDRPISLIGKSFVDFLVGKMSETRNRFSKFPGAF